MGVRDDERAVVALTGASGFLGRHVRQLLGRGNQRVVAIGRRDADLTVDLAQNEPAWQSSDAPTTLLHCAGIMGVDATSVIDSARIAAHLLEHLPPTVRRLVLVSSAYVYAPSETNVGEDEPPRPSDAYGHTKLMVESMFQGFARATNRQLVVLRPCAIYGPGDPNQKAITKFIGDARRGVAPTLKANATFPRDYIHVSDAARGVVCALDAKVEQGVRVFNICTGLAWSAAEIARRIVELEPKLGGSYGASEPDMLGYRFDPSRAQRELGFKAETDLPSALSSLLRSSEPEPEPPC
jgi:UDP-glucuronate 4-epimerase